MIAYGISIGNSQRNIIDQGYFQNYLVRVHKPGHNSMKCPPFLFSYFAGADSLAVSDAVFDFL